jgi:hypothetical protein
VLRERDHMAGEVLNLFSFFLDRHCMCLEYWCYGDHMDLSESDHGLGFLCIYFVDFDDYLLLLCDMEDAA